MQLLLLMLVLGTNCQHFFDTVMSYNAKAEQFLEQKEAEQPAYPPKPTLLINLLDEAKPIYPDSYAFKSVVGSFLSQTDDIIESLRQSEVNDAQFGTNERETYTKYLMDLKWKEERVKKDFDNFLEEADVVQSRISENNRQLADTRKELEKADQDFKKQLLDIEAKIENVLKVKTVFLEALESGVEQDYFKALGLVKDRVQLFNGRHKNTQVDKFLLHPNFNQDKKAMSHVLSLLINYLLDTQTMLQEQNLEIVSRWSDNITSLNFQIIEYENADRTHKEHMKMIKDRQILLNDDIQLAQRSIREMEKEFQDFTTLNDQVWKIEDRALYYMRQNKKLLTGMRQ